MARCPHCGGVYPDGETCQDRFDAAQAQEMEQPAQFAVHHLSVPGYLLQHNAYCADVRRWAERVLADTAALVNSVRRESNDYPRQVSGDRSGV